MDVESLRAARLVFANPGDVSMEVYAAAARLLCGAEQAGDSQLVTDAASVLDLARTSPWATA